MMTPASDQPAIDFPGIDQVAFVVEDLEAAMDDLIQLFGVEPWEVLEPEPPTLSETTYYGESVEYGFRHALVDVGDVMIELSEPLWGPSVYQDYLAEHGPGPHHIAYSSWDEAETYEVVASLQEAGVKVAQSGVFAGTEFWYFDTREQLNGLMFETAVRRNLDNREPGTTYP
jgi:catechol 2,3-dioxygenase-like lactoylglutathione lyase family enzyme